MVTKKILVIDGGGMYGVVPLEVCIAIEERIGKPLGEIFDLFVGTSTGAIISASAFVKVTYSVNDDGQERLLAPPRLLWAKEIMNIYYYLGIGKIFSEAAKNDPIPGLDLIFKLYDQPRYKNQYFEDAIKKVLGSRRKMGRLNILYDAFISLSTYNVSKGQTQFFRSWVDSNVNLEDAVLASSVAPTYHSLHEVDGSYYIDGGVFAVNPAAYALKDGFDLCERGEWPDDSQFVIVSLGTGKKEPKFEPLEEPNPNKISDLWWVTKLPNIVLDGQDESTNALMKLLSKNNDRLDYFRFNVELDGIDNKKSDETDRVVLDKAREIMRDALDDQLSANFNRMIEAIKRT